MKFKRRLRERFTFLRYYDMFDEMAKMQTDVINLKKDNAELRKYNEQLESRLANLEKHTGILSERFYK